MTIEISSAAFPSFQHSVRAKWAPIVLEPVMGSYERIVIAVAVVGQDGFHIETANALSRLSCFYAENAVGVEYAIHLAADFLRQDLAARSLEALLDPKPALSGVHILECREAEGRDLKAIGASWMSALSSLYREEPVEVLVQKADLKVVDLQERRALGGDRLPALVMDYVKIRRSGFYPYFSPDLREGKKRRFNSHEVVIDFSGSRVAVNFGTLRADAITKSVYTIKRRLWDLKVNRERTAGLVADSRQHEMLVQAPRQSDPQVTAKQQSRLEDALGDLREQADKLEMRLEALSTVEEIGDRLLEREAA